MWKLVGGLVVVAAVVLFIVGKRVDKPATVAPAPAPAVPAAPAPEAAVEAPAAPAAPVLVPIPPPDPNAPAAPADPPPPIPSGAAPVTKSAKPNPG